MGTVGLVNFGKSVKNGASITDRACVLDMVWVRAV